MDPMGDERMLATPETFVIGDAVPAWAAGAECREADRRDMEVWGLARDGETIGWMYDPGDGYRFAEGEHNVPEVLAVKGDVILFQCDNATIFRRGRDGLIVLKMRGRPGSPLTPRTMAGYRPERVRDDFARDGVPAEVIDRIMAQLGEPGPDGAYGH